MDVTFNYFYAQSDSFLFQGTEYELQQYINDGYYVVSGSNGSWNITRPAYGRVNKIVNNTVEASVSPTKDFLKQRYNKVKVTENDYRKLVSDLKNNRISFEDIH